jgi:hypothetical protein
MYFAVQAMGAELATCVSNVPTKKSGRKISMLVANK